MFHSLLKNLVDTHEQANDDVLRSHIAKAIMRAAELIGGTYIEGMTKEEIILGKTQGKIVAIKAVRSRLNLGLKDAKDLVEEVFSRLGETFYTYPTKDNYQYGR